ncbi:DUF4350 domain-containing protein [Paraliobacillus sp. JSM ZJ581]|uniref:DUF4350 domain-containing protein n=1 Tax=Paraliobacillus sp. JSM ZJ581 TaxID=3342118 RepID=UPI0035A86414
MSQQTTDKKMWLWLLILLSVFVLVSYFLVRDQPKDYPAYLSKSPAPNGTKALYTFLEQEQVATERLEHNPTRLENLEDTLLVMVEPPLLSDEEALQLYESYMENGNTIVLFKQNPKGMFDIDTSNSFQNVGESTELLDKSLHVSVSSTIRLEHNPSDVVLLEDKAGAIAIERSYGDGHLLVVTEPEWLTNENILEQDHLDALFSIIDFRSYQSIIFNEYIHNPPTAFSKLLVYPNWILVVWFEIFLLLIGVLWLKGKRFGSIVTPREATVRFSNERIKAIANWYLKGKNYRDAVMIQSDFLKRRLLERYGIPYKKSWVENIELIDRITPSLSKEAIRIFAKGLEEIVTHEKISKQAFIYWSQKIDHIRKEVESE